MSNTSQHTELFSPLKTDEFQLELAQKAEQALFSDEQAAQNTAQTINDFVDDYLENGRSQPIAEWLIGRFNQYPDIWTNEQEKLDTAEMIISTVDNLVANQLGLEQHLAKGKTVANFINHKIKNVAEQIQVRAEDLAGAVDQSLNEANQAYVQVYTGQALDLSPESVSQESLDIARKINQRAIVNANLNLAWWGAKSIGARLINAIQGKENASRAEQLRQIIRSAVDSSENKGVQVAVSGGLVVSAKKGWVKGVFDVVETIENSIERGRRYLEKVSELVLDVGEGWNELRLLDRLEQGALRATEVAAEKAKFMVVKVITNLEQKAKLACEKYGGVIGASVGAFVGNLIGQPVLGKTVGSFLGEKAGKWVSEKVVSPLAEKTKQVANKAIDFVEETAKSVISTTKEFVADTWNAVKESKLNPFNWF